MMSNTSIELYISLKNLLSALECAKCNTNLYNPRQFLKCGHILCTSCTNRNNIACIECQCFLKNKNYRINDNIDKIVQICCNIAEIVGFKKSVQNIEENFKCVSLKEETKNNISTSEDNLNLQFSNSNTTSNIALKQSKIKPLKRFKKRKKYMSCSYKNSKKAKHSSDIPKIPIPRNINKRNHHGETKLQEECKKGHKENVQNLLKAGADPNIACNANWTPLQECADYGFYEVAKILLESGANVNQPGHEGRTPLHEAAKNNNLDMINLFLKYNAKKDILDDNGKKPLDDCNLREIRIILNSSTKDNIRNHDYKIKQKNKNPVRRSLRSIKNRKMKNIFNSEHCTKIENNANHSDLENDIKIVSDDFYSNNITNIINHSDEIVDNKDNIFYNSSQDIDVVNICDSEKVIVDGGYLENIINTANQDSKYNKSSQYSIITVNTESEEIIDIIN